MARSTATTQINARPEDVWSVVSDVNRFEEWLTLHDKWKSDVPDQVGVGSRVTEQITVMGMTNVIEWDVKDYRPNSTLRISGTGMAGVQITIGLLVDGAGPESIVTIDAEFTGQMVVGAIAGALEKNTAAELEASLEKLQGLVK